MFDIISKDSLRRQIEAASNNQVTVLYDDKGYPSFMGVIPRMTIGDCFPEDAYDPFGNTYMAPFLDEIHPAFKIHDSTGGFVKNVSEIFIGQYRSYWIPGTGNWSTYRAVSLPGYAPVGKDYYNLASDPDYPIRAMIEGKGSHWHMMNIWEYSLLQFWAYKNGIEVEGNQVGNGYDYSGRSGVVSNYALRLTSTMSPPFQTGERLVGLTSGASGTYISDSVWSGVSHLTINDVYGLKFVIGETVQGMTTGYTGTIENGSYGVTARTVSGSGPLTWSHNHKSYGIWDLASASAEVVDGCRVRTKTVSDTDYHMLMLTPGNYYQWDDAMLQSYPVKMASYTGGGHTNLLKLGYQDIDGNGDPQGSGDDNIDKTTTWGMTNHAFLQSDDYVANVTAATRKMFTIAGLDMVTFPESESINKREYTRVRPTTVTERIMSKTYAPNSSFCGMWTSDFWPINQSGSPFSFRVVYVP